MRAQNTLAKHVTQTVLEQEDGLLPMLFNLALEHVDSAYTGDISFFYQPYLRAKETPIRLDVTAKGVKLRQDPDDHDRSN